MSDKPKKSKKAVAFPVVGDEPEAIEVAEEATTPERGPDYHITASGDIVLDTGAPVPEDHPIHPVHRAIAAGRKEASK